MRARGKHTPGIAIIGALFVTGAAALPDDALQPIEIEAGSAMRDERQGLTVYEREVVIRQGSILINADTVTVHTAGTQVNRIVATGRPATYQQQTQPDESPMVARANTIEYQLADDQIHLVGNAIVEQAGTILSGNRIDYDLGQEIIRASGDEAEGGRIRMVIPPDQQRSGQPRPTPPQPEGTDGPDDLGEGSAP